MKTITNKALTYIGKDWNENFTKLVDKPYETSYFELIEECCNRPSNSQQGFSYNDIKNIDRIKTALKDKTTTAELEDADFEFLQKQVSTFTWKVADIQFVEFMDYIKEIK
jgi:hypothetical protein